MTAARSYTALTATCTEHHNKATAATDEPSLTSLANVLERNTLVSCQLKTATCT